MSASWFSVSKATLTYILTKLKTVFDTKAEKSFVDIDVYGVFNSAGELDKTTKQATISADSTSDKLEVRPGDAVFFVASAANDSLTISSYDTHYKIVKGTGTSSNQFTLMSADAETDYEEWYTEGTFSLSKSDIGLSNVGNFKAVSTLASQGLSDIEKINARTNIGAGTSNFSGSYNALSDIPSSFTPSSHTHGNIQNGGTLQTNDVAIASGDKLVITDSSDSSKIARASIAFDGSTATKCLTQKGTWENFTNNAGTVTSVKVGNTSYSPTSGVVSLPAYPTTLPASDVYAWAKASTKPSYTLDEVSDGSTRKLANYIAKAGDTMTGTLRLGSSNQSTMPTCGLYVHDIRNATVKVDSFSNAVNFLFDDSSLTNYTWQASMLVRGWNGGYNAWELVGPASDTDQRTLPLYVRTSNKTTWGSWRKIYDTSNPPAWSEIGSKPSSFTPSSHTHGNIQNGGTLQTNDITIASGDKLVVTDSSDSSKIARASISFDGSTATKCLTQKGTWESFTNNAGTVTLASTSDSATTVYYPYFGTNAGAGKYQDGLQYTPKFGGLRCYNTSGVLCWALYDDDITKTIKEGSYLSLGNAVTSNNGGARIGVVRLYRNGHYTDIESSVITANRTVEIADQDGYIPVLTSAADNDSTSYNVYFGDTAGAGKYHSRLDYTPSVGSLCCTNSKSKPCWELFDYDIDNTALGGTRLILGNSLGPSDAGSRYGVIALYDDNGYPAAIRPNLLSASRDVYIPDQDGTLALREDFVVDDILLTSQTTINPGTEAHFEGVNIYKSGYKPLAVIGWYGSYSTHVCLSFNKITGNTIECYLRSISNVAVTPTYYIRVLYIKNS